MASTHDFEPISKSLSIHAPATTVWQYLTTPRLMNAWMLDEENALEIASDWKTGSPLFIKGRLHGTVFENRGVIVKHEPGKAIAYTHLSSLSKLEDRPENYCVLNFDLTPCKDGTTLSLTIHNFPTESIYRHMAFYWNSAICALKTLVENDLAG